jgi:hypothetical protein
MIGMKKIFSYKEYLKLQKRKTEDPMRRSKWIDKIEENTQKFKPTFQQYMGTIGAHKNQTSYCLGARTGEEVLALRELGFTQAMGTDLVPHEDYVIECDIHNMIFEDNSVSFYYTNIFDHSINPVKFLSEIQRTLLSDGFAFFQLQIGSELDEFGTLYIDDPKDFHKLIDKYERLQIVISEENIVLTPHNHGLNWNVIVKKI